MELDQNIINSDINLSTYSSGNSQSANTIIKHELSPILSCNNNYGCTNEMSCNIPIQSKESENMCCPNSENDNNLDNQSDIPIDNDEIRSFKCDFCPKRFTQKRYLKQHLLIHSSNRQHKCEICGKTFKQKSVLNRHKLSHIPEKRFQCEICTKHFTLKAHLQRHILIHFGEKAFRCNLCGRMFPQKQELNEHMLTHSQVKRYVCEVCDQIFITKTAYHEHILTHGTEKIYLCNVCSKTFCQKTALDEHLLDHNQEKNFICDICNKGFAQRANLSRHKLIHLRKNSRSPAAANWHSSNLIQNNETEPPDSADSISGRSQDNETSNYQHDTSHSTDMKGQCSTDCHSTESPSNQFLKQVALNQIFCQNNASSTTDDSPSISDFQHSHLNLATQIYSYQSSDESVSIEAKMSQSGHDDSNSTPECSDSASTRYQCPVCMKFYQTQEKLRRHSKIHANKDRFLCDICNKTFSQKRYLKQHRVTHSDVKSFQCEICSKSFSRNSYLSQHKLNHKQSEDRRYKCEICSKGFSQRSDVKRHKLTHVSERNFHCDLCDKSFIQNSHLVAHKLTHTEDKKFVCDVCNRGFLKKANLFEHRLIHESEKRYVCDICGRAFAQKTNLSRHKLIHLRDKDGTRSYYSMTSSQKQEFCGDESQAITEPDAFDSWETFPNFDCISESSNQFLTSELSANKLGE